MLTHMYFTLVVVLFVAVVFWEAPIFPIRRISRSRVVRTARSEVWKRLMERPSNRFVSDEAVVGDPKRHRVVIDTTNGLRQTLDYKTYEDSRLIEEETLERKIVASHDIDYIPEAQIVETWHLSDHPEGTLVTLTRTRNILQSLSMMLSARRGIYNALDWFQDYCEGNGATKVPADLQSSFLPSASSLRRNLTSLAFTIATFASLVMFVSWSVALLMMSVMIVHEFGHWIGFKIAGHTKPRMMLLPFVGGVVISDRPFRSAREEAFVSLMGPGFSALYGLAFMIVAFELGADFGAILGQMPSVDYARLHYADIMCVGAAALIGVANIFQMIPVPPLDGGYVWRALLHSDRHRFVRYVFPVVATLVTWLALQTGNMVFAAMVAFLCIIWPAAISSQLAIPAMSAREKTVIGSVYVVVAAIHLAPIYVLLRPFM